MTHLIPNMENHLVHKKSHELFLGKIVLVVISLIPSVEPQLNNYFFEASKKLKKLVKNEKYSNAHFFNMWAKLAPNGQVIGKYFNNVKYHPITKWEYDPHLSKLGAQELASTIFDHCTRFVVPSFGQ